MEKTKFFDELKDALELTGNVDETTPLQLTSLLTLAVIAFVDENFGKQIKTADLKDITSVKNLMTLIGLEHFNG